MLVLSLFFEEILEFFLFVTHELLQTFSFFEVVLNLKFGSTCVENFLIDGNFVVERSHFVIEIAVFTFLFGKVDGVSDVFRECPVSFVFIAIEIFSFFRA